MKVSLVGGIDRLEPHYRKEAKKAGHELKVFLQYESGLESKLRSTEVLVLFTAMISHSARNLALQAAKSGGMTVVQSHTSGISAFRECLAAL
jgi:hypothetical protein